MLKRLLYLLLFVILFPNLQAKFVKPEDLSQYAVALNIEGGLIPHKALSKDQIWANLTIILDRPMITGKTLEDITASNAYPLKEASIPSYNELKVNQA